jgi:hypothetical protein
LFGKAQIKVEYAAAHVHVDEFIPVVVPENTHAVHTVVGEVTKKKLTGQLQRLLIVLKTKLFILQVHAV